MSRNQRLSSGDSRWPSSAVIPGTAGLRVDEWVEPGSAGSAGQVIVEVTGDVDDRTAPSLLSALTRAIVRQPRVCCDLSAVDRFGATGADVLAVAHLTAAVARGSFSVRGVRGCTAQVLETTGLDRILTVVR
jgi:anti-anti-sigma factor